MKKLLLMLMTMIGLGSCANAQSNESYANMNVDQFAKYIATPGVQLLDVRTPEEYAEGHIKGAININVFDRNFTSEAEKELDKSRPVAVYCRSGRRSADAARMLAAKGYKVTNLLGGFLAWESK